ncbi:MAG: PIN domain nuclease [Verrucomicrobiales bacterium VVV1]|nr:MAG: PIN domain nuclease [Verrucomicrobiales bacterium VVV1]
MPFLLDTCAILFIAEGTTELSPETLRQIDAAPPGQVFVSAISLGELACLQDRGRITLTKHWRTWWDELLKFTGWICLPITDQVMAEAYSLPPPIHRDPADLSLIATARLERLTLVTTDRKILDYPHVATIS